MLQVAVHGQVQYLQLNIGREGFRGGGTHLGLDGMPQAAGSRASNAGAMAMCGDPRTVDARLPAASQRSSVGGEANDTTISIRKKEKKRKKTALKHAKECHHDVQGVGY